MKTIIKNGHVLNPANAVDEIMDIEIQDEKIVAMQKNIDSIGDQCMIAT